MPNAGGGGLAGLAGGGLAPLGFGQSPFSGIGAGLTQLPKQQLQMQKEKQQIANEKTQNELLQQQMQERQQATEDAQMSQLGKILRANTDLQFDPQAIQRYEKYMQSRGLPSALKVDPKTGRQYVDPDSIPNSGGVMDLTDEQKAYALTLPEATRRIEFPGQTEAFYTAPIQVQGAERKTIIDDLQKNSIAFSSGKLSANAFSAWLTSPDVRSVVGEGAAQDIIQQLNDPQWVQANIAPLAQAQIAKLDATKLSDAAKDRYYQMLTVDIPRRTAETIRRDTMTDRYHQEEVGIGQQRNANQSARNSQLAAHESAQDLIASQRADQEATKIRDEETKATEQGRLIDVNIQKIQQSIAQGNTALAGVQQKLLTAQITGLGDRLRSLTTRMNALYTKNDPTAEDQKQMVVDGPDGKPDPTTLAGQYYIVSQQLNAAQAQAANLAGQIQSTATQNTSAASGKPFNPNYQPGGALNTNVPTQQHNGKTYYQWPDGKYYTGPPPQ